MPRKKTVKKPKTAEVKKETKKKKVRKMHRLRGMKDVLFSESKYWDLVIRKARDLAKVYGFQSITTPVLEHTDLYKILFFPFFLFGHLAYLPQH